MYREISDGKIPSITLEESYCYRCRLPDNDKEFSFEEIHAPKIGIAKAGRYNHSGQSVLYLANNLETAVSEVSGLLKGEVDIWHQKYHIKKIDQIINLNIDWE